MQVFEIILEFLGHVHNLLNMSLVQYNLPILVFVIVKIGEGDRCLESCVTLRISFDLKISFDGLKTR